MTFWLRPFLFLDHYTSRPARLFRMIRDEVLWGFVSPSQRETINAWIYSRDKRYIPGGSFYEEGLFGWEIKAIETPPFPKAGAVLLGGAGAGREASALRKRGYRVTAFETLPDLASQGQEIFVGSYADLGRNGSLRKIIEGEKYDAVILGWGSLSNLLSLEERQNLFQAIKKIAPSAPLLVSFLPAPTIPAGKIEWMRKFLRSLLPFLGAKQTAAVGDVFLSTAGFAHPLSPEEVRSLADNAGYDVSFGDLLPYPHALLEPNT